MAQIKTIADVNFVITNFLKSSAINKEQASALKETVISIINHPELQNYYTSGYTIYNERDIIAKDGIILRPDRIVVNANNDAIIIDYKTGLEDKKHWQQLQSYQDVLEDMEITVSKKILIYLNDTISVKVI